MGGPDGHPGAVDPVDRNQEEAVERLRVRGGNSGDEAVRAALEEREGEVVALVRVRGENRLALVQQRRESRNTGGDREHDEGMAVQSTQVSRERYAVVSCHVERPLDDEVWARFVALQRRRPGGFAIAALMRPADAAFGEDEALWLERARQAASLGPLGHHAHWTAPGSRAADRTAARASACSPRERECESSV